MGRLLFLAEHFFVHFIAEQVVLLIFVGGIGVEVCCIKRDLGDADHVHARFWVTPQKITRHIKSAIRMFGSVIRYEYVLKSHHGELPSI